ncbi:hypothetical protein [Pseudomonas fulva]|uniref:hypothetical protein n=1 Tax=Pseudomonas fulva TaxID=47880 RepID=UPI0015E45C67|nr:hypothetical protein [Pseudomonas fulva]MBA1218181.1 hypothetical protein [Pseudomonas fulva]
MNDAGEGDVLSPEELAELRRDAERYRWLRQRAVRLQGSEIWWQGGALDLRVDTGLGHVQGECTVEVEPRRVTRIKPKLTHSKEPRA